MSRFCISLGIVLALVSGAAAEVVWLDEAANVLEVELAESGLDRTVIEYQLGAFSTDEVVIAGRTYHVPSLGGESNVLARGLPDLPNVARSIVVPDDAEMSVRVLSSHYIEFAGMDIAPSRGEIDRSVDPGTVPYMFGAPYEEDSWYPTALAEARTPYILRDMRGIVVVLNPFQYNPASRTLRVYDRVTVEVTSVGPGKVNVLSRPRNAGVTPEFAGIYERHFLNYDTARLERYSPVGETGDMLVISYGDFMSAMGPFVDWKNQMGVPCEMVDVSTIGGSAGSIQSYIQGYYDTRNLAFVLLVGDAAQVPSHVANGGTSDPSFSLVAGDDTYPDILVGRFSGETAEQIATQVLRSVEYEKQPDEGADWYHKGTGIASIQGPGDDGEYDDEHVDNLRADLLAFTYSEIDQIYDPTANPAMVASALNEGRGIVNYTGHGSYLGWGSSDFANSDVNALTNDNTLPFIWSVACQNGAFSGRTCFAEAWVRATNGFGEPTGAVAVLMSSLNQDWDEPMDAQDEMVDLLVAGAKRTFGGLSMNGNCHMLDEYEAAGEDDFLAWHIFGDPSLRLRTDTPVALSVSHASNVEPWDVLFTVTVDGVEGALCALSRQGVLYGSAFTDEFGVADIDILEPLPSSTDVTLTVTSFNASPYFGIVAVGEASAAAVDVTPANLSASVGSGGTASETLAVGNSGEPESTLHYDITVTDAGMTRMLDDSDVTVEPSECVPGVTLDLVFSLSNDATDGEWMKGASLAFPDGVVVNSCTDFVVSDRVLAWEGAAGNGARVTWAGDWWNVVYPGEVASATVNVTVDGGYIGNVRVIYGMEGDGYGVPPHVFSGALVIDCGATPLFTILTPNGNEAWGMGELRDITWDPSGAPLLVDLLCSADGGASWSMVAAGTDDDGEYEWPVDSHVSDNCLVMVRASSNTSFDDISDASFSIYQPVEWLSVAPDAGVVEAGAVDTVDVHFDGDGMADGDYHADLVVSSNGGDPVLIPVTLSVTSVGVDDRIPQKAVVYGNYPNPFSPATWIAFSVPRSTPVKISIYTVSGRLVRTLTDETYGTGRHMVPWDGRGTSGDRLSAGVYLYMLEADGAELSGKMVLLQ